MAKNKYTFIKKVAPAAKESLILSTVSLGLLVADVIIGLAPYAKTVVSPGGWFIVSGIIDDRAAETEEKLKQAGFEVTEVVSSDCWYAMLCRNPA